jgi:hypothetical protein
VSVSHPLAHRNFGDTFDCKIYLYAEFHVSARETLYRLGLNYERDRKLGGTETLYALEPEDGIIFPSETPQPSDRNAPVPTRKYGVKTCNFRLNLDDIHSYISHKYDMRCVKDRRFPSSESLTESETVGSKELGIARDELPC